MNIRIRLVVVLTVGACVAGAWFPTRAQSPTPDLVIVNARVFTGAPGQPWAEALSIAGERIVAVGTTEEVAPAGERAGTSPRVIDAAGRLVIPGINDAHAHPAARPPHTARSRVAAVKSIVAAGVPLAIGSDGPMNPFLNMMFAAINEVNPPEALTLEQSLAAYTRGAAAAEMMDTQKGTLAPGMLADLAMLSQDIFKVQPPELPKTTSVLTIVGGRVVHEVRQ